MTNKENAGRIKEDHALNAFAVVLFCLLTLLKLNTDLNWSIVSIVSERGKL